MAYIEDKGVKLWYEITGKGEPLVLTGGFGCLHNQWDWIMDILNEDFQVINWNYRGSGQSDRYWAGGYSLDKWVDDLELILIIERQHFQGNKTDQCHGRRKKEQKKNQKEQQPALSF